MEKKISFSSECKIYDGKNPITENYENFILNIVKPKSIKIGISKEQMKNGLKPNCIYRPRLTIDQSWENVEDEYKSEVIKLLEDLVNRFDESLNKPIPLVKKGSSRCFFLNKNNAGLIFCIKEFLSQKSPEFLKNQIDQYNRFFNKKIDEDIFGVPTFITKNNDDDALFQLDEELEIDNEEMEKFFDDIIVEA